MGSRSVKQQHFVVFRQELATTKCREIQNRASAALILVLPIRCCYISWNLTECEDRKICPLLCEQKLNTSFIFSFIFFFYFFFFFFTFDPSDIFV